MLNTQKTEIIEAVKSMAATTDDVSLVAAAATLGITAIARQDVQDIRNRLKRELPGFHPEEKPQSEADTLFQALHFIKG